MKKIALIFCLLMLSFSLQGQKTDTKSTQILDLATRKYKSNKNTYFKFVLALRDKAQKTQKHQGIYYTTPTQYHLKVMDIEQIYDGKKVYNISKEDQEVTISKSNGTEMQTFSPVGYLNSYKKEYHTQYLGIKNIDKKNSHQIKLTPVKPNGIKQVNVFINTKNHSISRIDQIFDDGSSSQIEVKEYKENQKLNPNLFSFKKENYKNYTITEL